MLLLVLQALPSETTTLAYLIPSLSEQLWVSSKIWQIFFFKDSNPFCSYHAFNYIKFNQEQTDNLFYLLSYV